MSAQEGSSNDHACFFLYSSREVTTAERYNRHERSTRGLESLCATAVTTTTTARGQRPADAPTTRNTSASKNNKWPPLTMPGYTGI